MSRWAVGNNSTARVQFDAELQRLKADVYGLIVRMERLQGIEPGDPARSWVRTREQRRAAPSKGDV